MPLRGLQIDAGEVRVGTSGWSYGHWRGVLYPRGEDARRLRDRLS